MKDAADISTLELFPTPKKRGRPTTGKAKTAAERQALYRSRKEHMECKANINIWIDEIEKMKLDELANHFKLSKEEMIEKLIQEARRKLTDEKVAKEYGFED
jgi:hypothetical protein